MIVTVEKVRFTYHGTVIKECLHDKVTVPTEGMAVIIDNVLRVVGYRIHNHDTGVLDVILEDPGYLIRSNNDEDIDFSNPDNVVHFGSRFRPVDE